MAATNASTGAQFPKPSYNSGYGSTGYDALSQSTQDYNKGSYPGTGVGQPGSKGQGVSNAPPSGSGSDMSTSMYGKSHVALNKVNVSDICHAFFVRFSDTKACVFCAQSYEKQSFHSGTPPPFNLAGTQNAAASSGQAYGAQQLYITHAMPSGHHNMNMHQPIHQVCFTFLHNLFQQWHIHSVPKLPLLLAIVVQQCILVTMSHHLQTTTSIALLRMHRQSAKCSVYVQ